MTRELAQKAQSVRPKRTPLGQRNRLSVKDQDPNYVYRIVNTTDSSGADRIDAFKEAGYELVENPGTVGDKRVDQSTGLGKAPEISVGQGKKAVVMRIPREWYVEDQQAKQLNVDSVEETMYEKAKNKADYGSLQITK